MAWKPPSFDNPATTGFYSEAMLETMAAAPDAPPFPWPDQAGLDGMLAKMTHGSPVAD
jgi:hypothetical protein